MAVKIGAIREITTTFFLSRLCGGEGKCIVNEWSIYFLSRLCGGEVLLIIYIVISDFLSRLCGGEDIGLY